MNVPLRPTEAVIDLARLRANFRVLLAQEPRAIVVPMVKANAYGHGMIPVVDVLRAEGASAFGVALVEEGIELRLHDEKSRIMVFSAFADLASARAAVDNRLEPVVASLEQLQALHDAVLVSQRSQSRQVLPVHLEFNIGMNRLGFAVDKAEAVCAWFEGQSQLKLASICAHLSHGHDRDISRQQIGRFQMALGAFKGQSLPLHLFNSAGLITARTSDLRDLLPGPVGSRPGITLYGVSSSVADFPVQPVLQFRSRLALLHRIEKGAAVSYNGTWVAKRNSLIGVIPCGYADGYNRQLSNRGAVLCRGQRAPVVGHVCMDYFMVDLTEISAVSGAIDVGEPVVLIGEQDGASISVAELAKHCATIPYEILTGLSGRVPRRYVDTDVQERP